MDILEDELIRLWCVFEKKNLKYIMVGGFASILNGYNRLIAGINARISATKKNRQPLHGSLQETGTDMILVMNRLTKPVLKALPCLFFIPVNRTDTKNQLIISA